mgnify:CR=1 FL=1
MKEQLLARIQNVIDTDAECSLLSDWEKGFLESIQEQVSRRGSLSQKQLDIFSKSEVKCTPEAIEDAKSWTQLYKSQYRESALVVAHYYKNAGYFTGLAMKVLENPEFVPTRQAYKKMCENKYAVKVLETFHATPLYAVGSTVVLRGPALEYANRRLDGTPCLVLEILSEVVSAAKGGKQYKVLPYGDAMPLVFEERQIKKCKPNSKKKRKTKTYSDVPF